RTVYTQMCIAPVGFMSVVSGPVDVAVIDIDTAYKTSFFINHDDLAVVVIIEPIGKWYKVNAHEWEYLHAICLQALCQSSSKGPASKVVINKSNSDTFFCFLHQDLF